MNSKLEFYVNYNELVNLLCSQVVLVAACSAEGRYSSEGLWKSLHKALERVCKLGYRWLRLAAVREREREREGVDFSF